MTHYNPVISVKGVDHGDPAVIYYLGTYYLYHTGPVNIPVYRSNDLLTWESCGNALLASTEEGHWAQVDLWAPEVFYKNGRFYMYVTGAQKLADGSGNDEIRRIGVATSTDPLGPFTLEDQPLTDEWSIDAHPFQDDNGEMYMYYNVRNAHTRGPNDVIGTGNVVDKMLDLHTLQGKPTLVVKPEFEWEGNKENSFFWNEGPFVLKKDGQYVQMYSAGFFGDDTYGVYYATSSKPYEDLGYKTSGWKKYLDGTPILQTNDVCHGPGHHVVVKGPNRVEDFIIYHGYEPEEHVQERRVRVGRLTWEGTHIVLEEPSKEAIHPPAQPTIDGRHLRRAGKITSKIGERNDSTFVFEFWTTLISPLKLTISEATNITFDATHLFIGEKRVADLNVLAASFQCIRIEKHKEDVLLLLNGVHLARWKDTSKAALVIDTNQEVRGAIYTAMESV